MCVVVVIIYLALPSLPLSPLSEKRVLQRKDKDMGRRQSEPGLSPGETYSAALHEILFIIIINRAECGEIRPV